MEHLHFYCIRIRDVGPESTESGILPGNRAAIPYAPGIAVRKTFAITVTVK